MGTGNCTAFSGLEHYRIASGFSYGIWITSLQIVSQALSALQYNGLANREDEVDSLLLIFDVDKSKYT